MKPLSPDQRTILDLLARRQHVTQDAIVTALYGHLPECDWPDAPEHIIKVQICKLRKAVREHGIEICTITRGGGDPGCYHCSGEDRERARYILDHYWALVAYHDHRQMELFAHAG